MVLKEIHFFKKTSEIAEKIDKTTNIDPIGLLSCRVYFVFTTEKKVQIVCETTFYKMHIPRRAPGAKLLFFIYY